MCGKINSPWNTCIKTYLNVKTSTTPTTTIGKGAAGKTPPDDVVTEFPGVTRTHLEAPAGDAAIGPVNRVKDFRIGFIMDITITHHICLLGDCKLHMFGTQIKQIKLRPDINKDDFSNRILYRILVIASLFIILFTKLN